jgi:GNAT superfamily N-acetyltransferase
MVTVGGDTRIRQARRADATVIYELHTASLIELCSTHYPVESIRLVMAGRTPEGYHGAIDMGQMFVCELDHEVVGFGHAEPGEVLAVFVHPRRARQGIGSQLLSEAIARAGRGYQGPIRLQATLNAQPFYERSGFVVRARRLVRLGSEEFLVVDMELPRGEPVSAS